MTWAPGPIGDENPADLYAAVRELAVRSVDTLDELATTIAAGLEEDDHRGLQLVADLRGHRQELIETCRLQQQFLSRDAVEELRRGFALANLAGEEHEARRKEITEEVAGHPVSRLAELTTDEAARLNLRLRELEDKF